MALPNKSFLINYNARDFNPDNSTIARHPNQSFQEDMVLNAPPSSYTSDSITVNGQYFQKYFNTASANPFNRSGSQAFTIIAKTSHSLDSSGEHAFLCNRTQGGTINWIVFNPGNTTGSGAGANEKTVFFHNSNRFWTQTPYMNMNANPNIWALRISGGSGYGESISDSTTFRSISNTYGGEAKGFGIFTDTYRNTGFELWRGTFYWVYISTEALTDDEIAEVVAFNEGQSIPFSIDKDNISLSYSGGSNTIIVTSSNPWSASTTGNWFTLSSNSGSSGETITVSASANTGNTERIGSVTFTDGSESYTCIITQPSNNNVPFRKMWRSGNRIN